MTFLLRVISLIILVNLLVLPLYAETNSNDPASRQSSLRSQQEALSVDVDTDGDGIADHLDKDDDNDGLEDDNDPLPLDPYLLFFESWENGIDPFIWDSMGSSNSLTLKGEGRVDQNALDPAGGIKKRDGVISRKFIPLGVSPELSFWLKAKSTKKYWQNMEVTWSIVTPHPDNPSQLNAQSVISFTAMPEKASGVFKYCMTDECVSEPWNDELHHDVWQFYKIAVNDNGTVSFWRDGQKVWQNKTFLDFTTLPPMAITVVGQSNSSPQLIDDIAVTLPDGRAKAIAGWRRWEGQTGAFDKPAAGGVGRKGFYTRGLSTSSERIEFEFKVLESSQYYAPAFFYFKNKDGLPSSIKFQIDGGDLLFSKQNGNHFQSLSSLAYPFVPETIYRCIVDEQQVVHLYQDGELLISGLKPPTHLEAQVLPDNDKLLLLWLPPENESFSHVRIYRSFNRGEKGKLIADHVTGMTYVDEDFYPGISYFYGLYAVDKNGNEGRDAAKWTQFRGAKKEVYKSFAELPDVATGKSGLVGNSVVTIPLRFETTLTSDILSSSSELFAMNPATNGWVKSEQLVLGQGYYLRSDFPEVVLEGNPLHENASDIKVKRGWNVIGNPYLNPVSLEKVSVSVAGETVSFGQAVEKGWVAEYLYANVQDQWYVSSANEPDVALPPWRGIYLLLAKDARIRFVEP